ncbi:MAG: DUF3261 domain-containing protein [Methylobacter sp.]|nr:DUF3261 domain-containing protein [Methylobacter sp.]
MPVKINNYVFVLLLMLSACALNPLEENIDNVGLMPIAQPLEPSRRIVQQINAFWSDREESLLAVLELDKQHIAMAGLSNDGLSLFNITYDGKTVLSDKSPLMPATVKPEFMLADMQLVYWPLTTLQTILPVGWRLETLKNKRFLYINDKKQMEINYLSPETDWPKVVELVNFQYHYRLRIKTLNYELIPQ